MIRMHVLCIFFFSLVSFVFGQRTSLTGTIFDDETKEALEAAVVSLENESYSVFEVTDKKGIFKFDDLPLGRYTISYTHLGYQIVVKNIELISETPLRINVMLTAVSRNLEEIRVVANSFQKPPETPLSTRSLGQVEIQKNPGSGSDIAKVMQVMPGVVTTTSFRNDLIIRGGSPAENSFYVDGIRVPSINHLSTQGSSGGAISLLNSDFIQGAELISSSFPANRSNALSSVFHFDLKDGMEESGFRISAGATNLSLDAYGPLGEKASFVGSVRRSYRQYILKLIGLAVYPVYHDALLKFTFKPSPKNELTVLGLGAFDKFRLNSDINESEVQAYLLDNLPENDQWNYTVGINHKLYGRNSVWEIVASRSHLYNKAFQETDVVGQMETTLNYESTEINHRLATEYVYNAPWAKIRLGGELTQRNSTFDVFNLSYDDSGPVRAEYNTSINYLMYGAHLQVSNELIKEKWSISWGMRVDGSDFATQLNNPLNQFSPRASTSLQILKRLKINGGVGIYYQQPADITLGYAEAGKLINQNEVKYIRSDHMVAGLEYQFKWSGRMTAEIFRKSYSNYPFNTRENISQANEGGQFGVAGNSPIRSNGKGVSEGFEFMYEQKLYRNWYGTLSYTFSTSEFEDQNGALVSSSWDANHIVNIVLGKKFKRSWEAGFNLRYQSALPYTPFDLYTSSLVSVWNVNREGIRDYNQLNALRGKSTLLLDFRIDKQWAMNWGLFTFYLDLENVFFDADSQQVLLLDKSGSNGLQNEGAQIINPNDPFPLQRYKLKEIQNAEGILIPTFGFVLDF